MYAKQACFPFALTSEWATKKIRKCANKFEQACLQELNFVGYEHRFTSGLKKIRSKLKQFSFTITLQIQDIHSVMDRKDMVKKYFAEGYKYMKKFGIFWTNLDLKFRSAHHCNSQWIISSVGFRRKSILKKKDLDISSICQEWSTLSC